MPIDNIELIKEYSEIEMIQNIKTPKKYNFISSLVLTL